MLTHVCLIIATTPKSLEDRSYFSYNGLQIGYSRSVELGQIIDTKEGVKVPHWIVDCVETYSFEPQEKIIQDLWEFISLYSCGKFIIYPMFTFAGSVEVPKQLTDKYLKSTDPIFGGIQSLRHVRPYDDIVKLFKETSMSLDPKIQITDFLNILAYPGFRLNNAVAYINKAISEGISEIRDLEMRALSIKTSIGQLTDSKDFGRYVKEVRNALVHFQRTDPEAPQIDLDNSLQEKQIRTIATILGRMALDKLIHSYKWYQRNDFILPIDEENVWWMKDEFYDDIDGLPLEARLLKKPA